MPPGQDIGSSELLRRATLQQLEDLQRAGIDQLAKKEPQMVPRNTAAPHTKSPETKADAKIPGTETSNDSLEIVQREVATCQLCHELATTRTQTVFGVGNPTARLCFLGEAPGADEDRQGEPFVGRAGKLLTDIIEKGMNLRRSDVYILNILKCRPPGNRNPLPEEATNCRGFLDRQLAIIQPEFLCCLGAVAAHNLLDTTTPIGRMRGQFYNYGTTRVMCTYHPAYLLRNPSAKQQTWDDIQMLMAAMGLDSAAM